MQGSERTVHPNKLPFAAENGAYQDSFQHLLSQWSLSHVQ